MTDEQLNAVLMNVDEQLQWQAQQIDSLWKKLNAPTGAATSANENVRDSYNRKLSEFEGMARSQSADSDLGRQITELFGTKA